MTVYERADIPKFRMGTTQTLPEIRAQLVRITERLGLMKWGAPGTYNEHGHTQAREDLKMFARVLEQRIKELEDDAR